MDHKGYLSDMQVECSNCHLEYPQTGAPYRCPKCGGLYDFSAPSDFDRGLIDFSQPGIWRYRHSLELPLETEPVSLGEGNTPLVWAEAFGFKVAFKCEHLNPTGSFHDRGSAVLSAFLRQRGITQLIADTTGNAGASLAAYAARCGIGLRVFLPDSASRSKRAQCEAYGAEVVQVLGPYSNASEAVRRMADQGGVYASHAFLPFSLSGYATIAYELMEQVGTAPGSVVMPVGQGALITGVGRGFVALRQAGLIDQIPVLIGVQALACAPLWAVSTYGAAGLAWVAEGTSLAEGILIRHPVRGDQVLQMLAESGGYIVAVDEEQIIQGWRELAGKGFYVEPTSAVVWAALSQTVYQLREPIVVLLTASGFKHYPAL